MNPKVTFFLFVGLVSSSIALICPGCPKEADVNDPTVHSYLSKTLSGYKGAPTGTKDEQTSLVKVNKATSQIVNGVKYSYDFDAKGVKTQTLYECRLVVLERLWLGETKVLDYSCQPTINRNKRSVLGGEVELSQENGDVPHQLITNIITEELNKKQKSQHLMGVVKVLKATRQVVSGLLTKVSVEVAETDCPAGSVNSQRKCSFQKKGHQVCYVEVWEKPWLRKTEVTKFECTKKPYYCPGCTVEVSPDDETANECLSRTLFNLNTKAQSSKVWNLHRIIKVQSQVVAGIKYTIEFEAEDEAKVPHICNTVILSQPWVSEEPTVVDFECTPTSQWLVKRYLIV